MTTHISTAVHALVAAWLIVVQTIPAQGSPVYSQTRFPINGADGSDRDAFSRLGIQSADDLTLVSPATVRSVTWWGVFVSEDTPTAPVSFDLIFYSDAGGVPDAGSVISSTSVVFDALVGTGESLTSGASIYEFRADITPTPLPAGTKVWISVLADTDNDSDDNFQWAHDSMSGTYAFRGPVATDPWDTFTGRNLFVLDDAPIAPSAPRIGSIERVGDSFELMLVGGDSGEPWVIQHSSDAEVWHPLDFFEDGTEDGAPRSIRIPLAILPDPGADRGFFRATRLQEDSPLLRRLLSERAKWRLGSFTDYTYELRQNMGMISWHGTITVVGRQVASFETIDLQPPFVEVPEIPTIEDLFDRIGQAIETGAATVDVTWDPGNGIPLSAFIDLDPLLLDEERGWSVETITFDR